MAEAPELSHMSVADLVILIGVCGRSDYQSDKDFAKACHDEIARRKPTPKQEDDRE